MTSGGAQTGLDSAARMLFVHGLAGFVWLDRALVVTQTHGELAAGIAVGKPVGLSMLALYGLDRQIFALRRQPHRRLDLPNIAIATASGTGPRFNLHIMWDCHTSQYLLVMARAAGQAELERELVEQSRKRQILEAKQLEQAAELERVNTELVRVNRDLSEFADIISHDLRAPLRGMRYHAEDLEQALGEGETAAAAALACRLQTQARRMTHMLSDLLEYAQAGRKDEIVEVVDTRALVDSIVASLPRPATFEVRVGGNWPVVSTLSAPLDLVVRNLLDNAIKHHDRVDGRVWITATTADKALAVTIADDGPGIPPALHEAAFLPFRTLAGGATEANGSGMGLALVRRVAEAVGARLRLESDPAVARGSAFHLVWPVGIDNR